MGIDAGHQPLAGGFFVAGGAVDLPREVQPLDQLGLQAMLQLGGWEVVVLHRIAWPEHACLGEAGDLLQGSQLHLFGQAGGEAVDVGLHRIPALGFHEDLVAVLVGEAVDLVLDAGAVPGTQSADAPIEHRATVESGPEDVVHLGTRVGHPAAQLGTCTGSADGRGAWHVAEAFGVGIAGLFLQYAVVDASAIHTRGSAGLHPSGLEAEFHQLFGDAVAGFFTGPSAAELALADVHDPVHEGAAGEHHGAARDAHAHAGHHTYHLTTFHFDAVDAVLPEVDVGGLFQHATPFAGEEVAVVLAAGAPHGRSLAAVEHAELDGAAVADDAGVATQGIHLAHDLPLGHAPHGGVAAHLSDDPHVHGDQEHAGAQVGRCRRRFAAGMAAAHHHHIVCHRTAHDRYMPIR